jgi:hypothetical protein
MNWRMSLLTELCFYCNRAARGNGRLKAQNVPPERRSLISSGDHRPLRQIRLYHPERNRTPFANRPGKIDNQKS